MRNIVTVVNPAAPKRPTVRDLADGQMFRYPSSSNPSNVYMKASDTNGKDTLVFQLNNGTYYHGFNGDREIQVVEEVNVKR